MAEAQFAELQRDMLASLQTAELFVQDCYACADPTYRLSIRVITERAWHSLFARNLFIVDPSDRGRVALGACSRNSPDRRRAKLFGPTFRVATARGPRSSSRSVSRSASCSSAAPTTPAKSRNRCSRSSTTSFRGRACSRCTVRPTPAPRATSRCSSASPAPGRRRCQAIRRAS